MKGIKIPYDQLSDQALCGVIEEFVTREGTDYGEKEVALETKIHQVRQHLMAGRAVIVFDPPSGTCNILKSSDPALKHLES